MISVNSAKRRCFVLLAIALAVVAAACGTDHPEQAQQPTQPEQEPAGEPSPTPEDPEPTQDGPELDTPDAEPELPLDIPFNEPWHDQDGQPMATDALTVHQGSEHCDWERLDLLHMGWPLGTETDWRGRDHTYFVRDPYDDLSGPAGAGVELLGEWEYLDAIPEHAEDTGMRIETTDGYEVELWIPAEEDPPATEAYLAAADAIEVWPGPNEDSPGITCD